MGRGAFAAFSIAHAGNPKDMKGTSGARLLDWPGAASFLSAATTRTEIGGGGGTRGVGGECERGEGHVVDGVRIAHAISAAVAESRFSPSMS
mmetsp:Transcript_90394/g.258638  ORF Transcript_90394/g.258638 Transcript_90394/m.258638 type:complete len:92 (-) Transcript_90394:261-536(-)